MDLLQSSLKMGERLKELRESKKLSFYGLSAAIKERYGVNISHDSLRLYEISEQYNSNAGKNNGMSLKNLKCLAAFYGVSADYLLGISDVKTDNAELAGACKYTGLDKETVEFLHLESVTNKYMTYISRLVGDLCLSGTLQRDVWFNISRSANAVQMDRLATEAHTEAHIVNAVKTDVANVIGMLQGEKQFVLPADVASEYYLHRAVSLLCGYVAESIESIRDDFVELNLFGQEDGHAD